MCVKSKWSYEMKATAKRMNKNKDVNEKWNRQQELASFDIAGECERYGNAADERQIIVI